MLIHTYLRVRVDSVLFLRVKTEKCGWKNLEDILFVIVCTYNADQRHWEHQIKKDDGYDKVASSVYFYIPLLVKLDKQSVCKINRYYKLDNKTS